MSEERGRFDASDPPDTGIVERPGRRAVGPIAFLIVVVLAILAIFWGRFVANPDIEVFYYNAGPIDELRTGDVLAFPEVAMFVVVLDEVPGETKQIRAIDGIAPSTGCSVSWDPDDERTMVRNPGRKPGSFTDPCRGARWDTSGDAVAGTTQPLKTPNFTPFLNEEGLQYVRIEVIGRSDPRELAPPE